MSHPNRVSPIQQCSGTGQRPKSATRKHREHKARGQPIVNIQGTRRKARIADDLAVDAAEAEALEEEPITIKCGVSGVSNQLHDPPKHQHE